MLSQTQVCLFTIVIIVVSSVSVSTRSIEDQRAFNKNRKRVLKYNQECPCGSPKETLVRLSDVVFTESIETSQMIDPYATVLHRCDPGQSCRSSHYYCAPTEVKDVSLIFRVSKSNNRSDGKYIEGWAQNHTECGCQPMKSLPK